MSEPSFPNESSRSGPLLRSTNTTGLSPAAEDAGDCSLADNLTAALEAWSVLKLEQWCQIARETLPSLGTRDGPDQPVWVCPATMLLQALHSGLVCSMMSVGPFLLLNQPLWRTLDQKELSNKIHGSFCADHGIRYTGWQFSSRFGVQRKRQRCATLNKSCTPTLLSLAKYRAIEQLLIAASRSASLPHYLSIHTF